MGTTPNVLFVITDQQRFDTIAGLGFPYMNTPNLDRLAREGVAFTRTYVTAPSCSPSRASLFTGLNPHSLGAMRNDDVWRHSWVELLAAQGYRCVNVGKMHTYPYDVPAGFHERHIVENKDRASERLPYLMDNWDKALWVRGETKPDRATLREMPDYRERLGAFEWTLPEDLHADAFVGSLARRWLETYPGDEPFFLQVGFPGPHPPYDATPDRIEEYESRDDLPMPVVTDADLASQPTALKELRRAHIERDNDAVVHLEHPTAAQSHRQRAHYYANVTMIDDQIGMLLDALESRGVLDDTLIVFTSDHGDALGDHGHSQKWTMYEPSVHVPAIVWSRGIQAKTNRIDSLVSHFDLGATVLDYSGIPLPEWMEAKSLRTLIEDPASGFRDAVYSEQARDRIMTGTSLMTMIRDDRWKLVEFLDSDEGQLFDLETDPDELVNLWDEAAHAALKQDLLSRIARWRANSSLTTSEWSASFR